MKYTQFKEQMRDKIAKFPMQFAFDNEQLEEGMKKLNASTKAELLDIGGGGFIRKVDSENFDNLFKEVSKETEEFLKDEQNLLDALEYELANHEYSITYDESDALNALGLSLYTMSETQKKILKVAKIKYLSNLHN